jgi:carboxymethylenebutenolidase
VSETVDAPRVRGAGMSAAQLRFETAGGLTVPVFTARPDQSGKHPALVLGYELFGMSEIPEGAPHMRDLAARFAAEGFVAAIPDTYAATGKQPARSNGQISGGPSEAETRGVLLETVAWLSGQADVDAKHIGAVGWCGGGRQVLLLAAHCPEIRAVASFYGRLDNRPGAAANPSPIDLASTFNCAVFGAYGEDDHAIPVVTARQFGQALEHSGVTNEIHIYPNAGHAFMNDRLGSYVADAAQDAWTKLIAFFLRELRQKDR